MSDPWFRTADLLRWGVATSGGNLSAVKFDENHWFLLERIRLLEANLASNVSIDYFVLDGTLMYIHLTDHSVQGPFDVPVPYPNFRDEWAATSNYLFFDWFTEAGGLYMVMQAHTSAGTFDANATDGSGHNLYKLILSAPSNVLPTGGPTGWVLTKSSATDYLVSWVEPQYVPSGGDIGQVLQKHSGIDYDVVWADSGVITLLSGLSDVTILASPGPQEGDLLTYTSGSWQSITPDVIPVYTPSAGTVSQILVKASGTDYDANWETVPWTLDCQINETDLLAHTTQQLVAPFKGYVEGLDTIVQKVITTGGTIKVQINGVDVTSAVATVASSATAGTINSATATAANTFVKGDIITLVIATFATAGAVNTHVRLNPRH